MTGTVAGTSFNFRVDYTGRTDVYDTCTVQVVGNQMSGNCIAHYTAGPGAYTISATKQPGGSPVAKIAGPATVSTNVSVQYDGSQSSDPNGSIIEYKWTIQKPNGTDTLFGPQVNYSWNTAGTYLVTLTVKDNNGQTASASLVVTAFPPGTCTVSDLSPITDLDAQLFENAAPSTPPYSLFSPAVDARLDIAIQQLQSDVASRFLLTPQRQSGYRPFAYQAHLYELRTKKIELLNAIARDSSQASLCAALAQQLAFEIGAKHNLRTISGIPQVSQPRNSAHTIKPSQAIDLDLSGLVIGQLIQLDTLAFVRGLHRPCFTQSTGNFDSPHFTLFGVGCDVSVSGLGESPVNLLLTAPDGKRIGYDQTLGKTVNELGPPSYYSGPNSEPQLIDVGGAHPGRYQLTATGTGVGPYTLTLTTSDEDGNVITTLKTSGIASVGSVTQMSSIVPSVDTTPPVIVAQVSGTLGNNGWYRGNVTVSWSVSDPESGILFSSGCTPTTLTANTVGTTLTCFATNGAGLSSSVPVTIRIDKTPPVISGMPAQGCSLWPPNNKMVQVATVTGTDALSGLAPGSLKVIGTSNEPSDPKDPDIVVTPNGSGGLVIQLRADRLGTGTGRIYTLQATALDMAGNPATATATCTVPHDQGQ